MTIASLIAAFLSVGSTAATTTFEVDGVTLSAPIPSGYCEPNGPLAEAVSVLNAADDKNSTPLTLVRCDQVESTTGFSQYILVKAPVAGRGADIPRAEFLEAMAKLVEDKEFFSSEKMAAIDAWAEKQYAQTLNREVKMDTTVRFVGADDACVYVAISGEFSIAGVADRAQLGGGCLTSVGGKILQTLVYGTRREGDTIASLMAKAAKIAKTLERR